MNHQSDQEFSLAGQLLIATPGMLDPNFVRTVSLICEHDPRGALGITINRPSRLTLADVLIEIGIPIKDEVLQEPLTQNQVLYGGPVHSDRGLILHNGHGSWESSIKISGHLNLTSSRDILEAIANGNSPDQFLMVLGYAGWGAGQLEQEVLENAWMQVPANDQLLFKTKHSDCWSATAATLGIDINQMSVQAGHA
ncbi:MAG: YqgE/AlgH family protein [Proteobacteria bacterium]|jgi:putative transcriptional regulator|nr:YqgE/AlgH family protein [Pseudomonadota bacterium]